MDEAPRTYVITKSQHVGYGFVAGEEWPTMVKKVESNGPSYDRLQPGDVIMAVNGINVENVAREQIIKMIQLSGDQIEITLNKSSNLLGSTAANQYVQRCHQPLSSLNSPDNQWQFNRLVTSISQQQHQNLQQHLSSTSPNSTSNNTDRDTPPVQIIYAPKPSTMQVLKQKSMNQSKPDGINDNNIKGKHLIDTTLKKGYGRFSPIPQRCKSSMDGAQGNLKNKKSNDNDHDQPLLKRRNTMRPIRPPPEVRELLQVVTKIFFEGGHSRTLKYDHITTVGVVLEKLNERLGKLPDLDQVKGYFGLALTVGVDSGSKQKDKAPKRKLLHILDENDSIMKIAQLPYSHRLRLVYRMAYPPSDVYSLYKQSKLAFEYLYQQSCNDLKLEGFSPEPDEDTALRLSALHLLEYVHSNHSKAHGNSKDPKVYIRLVKKERGLEYFVPASMAESVLDKDGKKVVSQYKKLKAKLMKQLKKNFEEFNFEPPKVKSTTDINRFSTTSFHELILPELRSSPGDYIKLLFLNYLSQMPCYSNPKRPVRASTSPMEQQTASSGDCSSSIESVPRTSDSLPLIKQDRNQISHMNNGTKNSAILNNGGNPTTTVNSRPDNRNTNNIARLNHMNSMRSLSSVRSPSQSQSVDQTDMAATPSIESISSITFNMQNSPSPPEAAPPYLVSSGETYNNNLTTPGTIINGGLGPSPMPRHQTLPPRRSDYNLIDKLYNQRYPSADRYIDDLLRNIVILPPPPPPSSLMYSDLGYQSATVNYHLPTSRHLTQILTDKDIEKLRVPPPPRFMDQLVHANSYRTAAE